jgi:hypothetical protein
MDPLADIPDFLLICGNNQVVERLRAHYKCELGVEK